jgi:hypothetical protein
MLGIALCNTICFPGALGRVKERFCARKALHNTTLAMEQYTRDIFGVRNESRNTRVETSALRITRLPLPEVESRAPPQQDTNSFHQVEVESQPVPAISIETCAQSNVKKDNEGDEGELWDFHHATAPFSSLNYDAEHRFDIVKQYYD